MDQIQVIYATKTKHSEKIAKAIGEAFSVEAENVITKPEIRKSALLLIVGGIYADKSLPELVAFVKELDAQDVNNVVLITSCVSQKQGQAVIRQILVSKRINVFDELICPGSFLFFRLHHPNDDDLKVIVEFVRDSLKKITSQK